MPDKIGGLPAHPLIVHLPIVFGPILGLLALGLLNPAWRSKLIKPLAALSIVTAVAAILAAESGEWLAGTSSTARLLSFTTTRRPPSCTATCRSSSRSCSSSPRSSSTA